MSPQVSRKHSFNLGSSSQPSPFQIQFQTWEAINQRAFLVCAGQMGGEYQRYKKLPNYSSLVKVCQDWKHNTFQTLTTFAGELKNATARVIDPNLRALDHLTDRLEANNKDQSAQDKFERTITNLEVKLTSLVSSANSVNNAVKQFCDVNQASDAAYLKIHTKPEAAWTALDPSPAEVSHATERIEGTWSAIVSDLRALREFMKNSVRDNMPFIVDLNVDAAIQSWRKLKSEAETFLSNVPAQRGFLSGNWMYDSPVIDVNKYYRLTNSFLGDNRCLDTYSGKVNKPFMNNGDKTSGSYWKFTRLGAGWYRMTNSFLGDKRQLDTYSGQGNELFMNQGENTSGTFWKITPIRGEWYRLTNLFLGKKRALDTYGNSHEPFMNHGENTSGTYWKLTPE